MHLARSQKNKVSLRQFLLKPYGNISDNLSFPFGDNVDEFNIKGFVCAVIRGDTYQLPCYVLERYRKYHLISDPACLRIYVNRNYKTLAKSFVCNAYCEDTS